MELYIARHGEAGSASSDELRALTANGVSRTRATYSQYAGKIQRPIATVVSSPLVCARQTAGIALELLPVADQDFLITDVLRPESTPEQIAKFLDTLSLWPVLLVGHLPVLGEMLYWLTEQEEYRSGIKTSSLFAVDLLTPARGCGNVIWHS